MKAWYFATEERKLRYGDNRPIVVGETHTVDPEKLGLCAYGLHASTRLIDALTYAPGPILYEVELSGKILQGEDKVCASERTYIREIDCTEILKEFAREQALINIDKIRPYCTTVDYDIILQWLNTGEPSLKSAAESAARLAESAAESAAAEAAARSARSAARSAAGSAAESAARSAAESAAESAARSAVESAAGSAAGSAAWPVAWSAAESAANTRLEEMIVAKDKATS